MKPVVILRGISGTGKTSVSLLLRERLQPAARLSVDTFRYFVYPRKLSTDQLRVAKLNAAYCAVQYCKHDMCSIIESVFESEQQLNEIHEIFKKDAIPYFTFTLYASLETILERNFSRDSFYRQAEKRVVDLYSSYNFDLGININTENKIIEEVADNILEHLQAIS